MATLVAKRRVLLYILCILWYRKLDLVISLAIVVPKHTSYYIYQRNFVASTDVIHLDAYEKPYLIWCLNAEAVLIKWIYLCFQALKDYKYS